MTTLLNLRTQILQRIDKVNSPNFTAAIINPWISDSCGDLYNKLANTNQDYNITRATVSLSGNADGYNLINTQTQIPNFWKPRNVEVLAPNASADPWVSIRRCPSQYEKHAYSRTVIDPLLGIPLVSYLTWGQYIEILPCVASAGTYRVTYIPSFGGIANDNDSIDGYYLSVNGWHEYVILDVCVKCLMWDKDPMVPEYMAQRDTVLKTVITSATPRDAGQPQSIVDIHHNGFGGPGFGGFGGGYGWGW